MKPLTAALKYIAKAFAKDADQADHSDTGSSDTKEQLLIILPDPPSYLTEHIWDITGKTGDGDKKTYLCRKCENTEQDYWVDVGGGAYCAAEYVLQKPSSGGCYGPKGTRIKDQKTKLLALQKRALGLS